MVVSIEKDKRSVLAPLFDSYNDTTIYTALEGLCSSLAFADDEHNPACALVCVGGAKPGSGAFGFVAGNCNLPAAEEIVVAWQEHLCGEGIILIPCTGGWGEVIEQVFGNRAVREVRYATRKDTDSFSDPQLEAYAASLPQEYALRLVDEPLYNLCLSQPWSFDLVGTFNDYAEFSRYALGVICQYNGELVGGAAAYSAYSHGIEIEIDTREDFRRRGIARACGARLILECRKRSLYPSWDAANTMSIALAQSLGYIPAGEYTSYWIGR